MAIARTPGIVIDCPDTESLANFYGALLGWKVSLDDGWAEVHPEDDEGGISFQHVDNYRAPDWPGQTAPQQMHLDLIVDDLDDGEAAAIELGATKTEEQPGTTFRVFLDPAGHPFCLCAS